MAGTTDMSRTERKGAEEARNQLPDLLEAAQKGHSTIVTKHGRPIAAIVPIDEFVESSRQRSLLPWKSTGRGLWGKSGAELLRDLRDEWSR
jgi:prevent-host-death family protein